jgi:hypothetical protein
MINRSVFLTFLLSKEHLFSRVFVFLLVLAACLVIGSLGLELMIVGAGLKVFKDVGLSAMNIFSFILIIWAGNRIMGDHQKKQNLDLFLLSKPFAKKDLLLANIITIAIQILLFSLLIGLVIFLVTFVFNQIWFTGIFTAIFFNMLEMILLLSFAALFFLLTSRRVAIPFLVGLYVLGHLMDTLVHFLVDLGSDAPNYILILIQSLLPNLEFFNWRIEIVNQISLPLGTFLHSTFYALSYSFLILLISLRMYARRDH